MRCLLCRFRDLPVEWPVQRAMFKYTQVPRFSYASLQLLRWSRRSSRTAVSPKAPKGYTITLRKFYSDCHTLIAAYTDLCRRAVDRLALLDWPGLVINQDTV